MAVGFIAIGYYSSMGRLGDHNHDFVLAAWMMAIGVCLFLITELIFRRYICKIEVLNDQFRITTKSILGIHINEGTLRLCGKLEAIGEILKQPGNSLNGSGATYILEPSGARYILDTTNNKTAQRKLDKTIRKLAGKRK